MKVYKNFCNYYDQMKIGRQSGTFQFEEGPFNKNVQSFGEINHEVLLLIKFLQTKPQVKITNIKHCDLYYTVI